MKDGEASPGASLQMMVLSVQGARRATGLPTGIHLYVNPYTFRHSC